MIKVGILTSGGDCQGLNGAMYGLVKGLTETNKIRLKFMGFWTVTQVLLMVIIRK